MNEQNVTDTIKCHRFVDYENLSRLLRTIAEYVEENELRPWHIVIEEDEEVHRWSGFVYVYD